MRTTLSIDDDVLQAAKERSRRERRSVGAILSELARQGLTSAGAAQRPNEGLHGFTPLPHRGPLVTNTVIDRIREDEAE